MTGRSAPNPVQRMNSAARSGRTPPQRAIQAVSRPRAREIGEPRGMGPHRSRSPRTIGPMSWTTILLAGLVALLVLIPTRRLQLAGWKRESLTTYYLAVWLLRSVVAAMPAPARFLLPFLIVAHIPPFLTGRAGIHRVLGRP